MITMNDTENKKSSIGVVQTCTIKLNLPPEGFKLAKGGVLNEITVAYECYGDLSDKKDNAVFICHALTGDAHVAGISADSHSDEGWWDAMIGPGKGIDTNKHQVICANILGGCKGTTGPASVNPQSGKAYGSSFPKITVADIVEVHRLLLRELGIMRLSALVGGSFGGMQIMEWLIRYSDEIDQAVIIASAASLTAQALAFDIVGRHAITSDPNWNKGDYYNSNSLPLTGLSGARKIAHITYLSQQLLTAKFGREKRTEWIEAEPDFHQMLETNFGTYFQIESYLEYQGKKFIQRFDANSYLHITLAMDEYDIIEQYGSLEKAFENISSRLLIVSLSGDWLFTRQQSAEMVEALVKTDKRVSFCHLIGESGHDAFLTHIADLKRLINAFLDHPQQPESQKCARHNISSTKMSHYHKILNMIPENSRVLDLGCNRGSLLNLLKHHHNIQGLGLEIEIEAVIAAIAKGCNVILDDIDEGLEMIPDSSFNIAVLSETLQTIKRPRKLLQQILRVANHAVVTFPNFAALGVRTDLLWHGRMPKEKQIPYEWYDTPNIHLFTLKDFLDLCHKENIKIESITCQGKGILEKLLLSLGFRNLGASSVIVHISKKGYNYEKMEQR